MEIDRTDFPFPSNLDREWLKHSAKWFIDLQESRPDTRYDTDPSTPHSPNSRGFTSPEFTGRVDLIATGCSHTWGMGVPDEHNWTRLLANSLGLSYVNLGVPGQSTMSCVSGVLAHIRDYGAPKYVVMLLPDYRRIDLVHRRGQTTMVNANPDGHNLSTGSYIINQDSDGPVTYSKKPHVLTDVVSIDHAFWMGIQYIEILDLFCKQLGITLIFSSWEDDAVLAYTSLGFKEKYNFYTLDSKSWSVDGATQRYTGTCHEDLSNLYGDNWYRGNDHLNNNFPHMGIHRHLDYSELFLNAIKEISSNETR